MTLDISGWTIVWVFLLILVLVLAVTTWVFQFWVKSPSPDSADQQEDKDDEHQNKNRAKQNLVNKKFIEDSLKKQVETLEEKLENNRKSLEKSLDELIKREESKFSNTSVDSVQLEKLINILGDKAAILQTMRQHFNFHGFKSCSNCGYSQVPIDKDAKYCPYCGQNPDIKTA